MTSKSSYEKLKDQEPIHKNSLEYAKKLRKEAARLRATSLELVDRAAELESEAAVIEGMLFDE